MKRIFLLLVSLVVLTTSALADLSDFPENFIVDDEFNGFIVVGENATSSDVIVQTNIALKVAQYIGKPQYISKMDTDVDLDNNLVLIGNPCVNILTRELLGNPEPCDKDFPEGKAYVKYIEQDDYKYLIIAGSDEEGTRQIADKVIEFEEEELEGEEIEIDVEVIDNRQDIIDALLARMNESSEQEPEPTPEETPEETPEPTTTPEIIIEESRSFFAKIWDWFTGLFER